MAVKQPTSQERVDYLQKLYENNLLKSAEGYKNVTSLIKSLLTPFLINAKGGYYKNGEKQTQFNIDDINDCYFYVMDRVYGTYKYKLGAPGRVKYDASKMNLASFIHTWIKGWCSQIRKKQYRRYCNNSHKVLYIDDILSGSKTPNNYIDNYNIDELEEDIELDSYSNSILLLEDLKFANDYDDSFFMMALNNEISFSFYNTLASI